MLSNLFIFWSNCKVGTEKGFPLPPDLAEFYYIRKYELILDLSQSKGLLCFSHLLLIVINHKLLPGTRGQWGFLHIVILLNFFPQKSPGWLSEVLTQRDKISSTKTPRKAIFHIVEYVRFTYAMKTIIIESIRILAHGIYERGETIWNMILFY